MEKLTYTPKEASQILGICLGAVYDLIHSDTGFPCVKLSQRRFAIPKAGLQRWLEERAAGSMDDGTSPRLF